MKYSGLGRLPQLLVQLPGSQEVLQSGNIRWVLSGGGSSGSSWFACWKYLYFPLVLYSVTFIRLGIPAVPQLSLYCGDQWLHCCHREEDLRI